MIREERLSRYGAFGWYLQCIEHGTDFKASCVSCGFCEDHNEQIRREIAEENGWLLDEPAGDVPL